MSAYAIQPLDAATLDAFVHLAEKHNGVSAQAEMRPPELRLYP